MVLLGKLWPDDIRDRKEPVGTGFGISPSYTWQR